MADTSNRSNEEHRRGGLPPAVSPGFDLADGTEPSDVCMRHLLRRPPRRPTGIRRFCLRLTAFAASLLFVAAVAATLLFVRLRQGPITLDLKPQIMAALNSRVGHGYHFDLSGTSIEATDHGPALTIDRLSVNDAAARPVISAPRAAISLDPLALLTGKVAPNRLDIHDVDLRLVILPDGQVAVSAGGNDTAFPLASALSGATERSAPGPDAAPSPADATASTPRPMNAALRAMSAALRSLVDAATAPDSAINALDHVSVTGRLVLDDRTHGTKTVFANTVLSFDRTSDGAAMLSVAADGPAGRWSLMARASAGPDGTKALTVDAQDLSLDEITLAGGLRSLGFDFDTPVSAHLAIKLGADGEIATAKGTFGFGQGYFKLDDPDHEPLLIDSVSGGFHLDRDTNGIDIDRTELHAGGSNFTITGHVDVPRGPDDPWAIKAEASGIFGTERPGEKPIRIARAGMAFRLFASERRLTIDRVEVTGPDVDFSDSGEIRSTSSGIRIRNNASVRHMPAQVLARLWPSLIAAPVRAWLLANLKGGTVESGSSTVDLNDADLALMRAERSVTDDHVRVDFKVSGLSLGFMAGVPSLDNVDATGVVTGHTFNMDVGHGTMDVSSGRKLTLADGTFRVPDSDPKPAPAQIEAHVQGGVDTVADLLSRDALRRYVSVPVDAAGVKGQIDGHLSVGLKIGKDMPPDDAKIGVTATATNFSMEKLIGKEGLSDATVKLDVDPTTGLRAKGEGRIYGAPAAIDLRKPATGPGEAVITLALDDAARAKAGFGAGGALKGSVAARVAAAIGSGDRTKATVDLDFAKAAIDGLVPGFSKPMGRPAKANFTVTQRDGGITLDNIVFEGGGASVRGAADLEKDGDFVSARLSQVRLSPGDDLKVDVQQGSEGLKVQARAANLDARPFLKWLSAPSTAGGAAETGSSKGSLDLDLRSTILTGQNSQAITGAELHLTRRGGSVRKLTLSGRIGRQPLTITTSQIDNAPHFLIHAGDAGASLLFMDLYKRMAGGRLDANIAMQGQRLDGYGTVHDFTVREDPAIRKLAVEGLASQKRDGDAAAADTTSFDPSATTFRKLEVYFTKSGNIVEIRDGSMFGPTLGATVAGTIDFSRDQVSLAGTFVPLFGVNNLFSQVPLFGPILGGGSHEGLLGLNYRITGSAANPVLNVNPLSVLAPGFLRQIFGAFDATARSGTPPGDHAEGPLGTIEQE